MPVVDCRVAYIYDLSRCRWLELLPIGPDDGNDNDIECDSKRDHFHKSLFNQNEDSLCELRWNVTP